MKDNLRCLDEHSYYLSTFFGQTEHSLYNWAHVAEWLNVAAGVIKVDFATARFDDSIMWCSEASHFEDKKTETLSDLVTNLCTFSFIWGALEAVVSNLKPKNVPGFPGKINAACYYLQQEYKPNVSLPFYRDLFATFMDVLAKNPKHEQLLSELRFRPYLSVDSLGLYCVYKIRNTFAHGALVFPEHEEWTGVQSYDAELIHISSRLVLLSIQMLLLSSIKADSFTVWCPPEYWKTKEDDEDDTYESEDVDADLFLRQVHLKCYRPGRSQLSLKI